MNVVVTSIIVLGVIGIVGAAVLYIVAKRFRKIPVLTKLKPFCPALTVAVADVADVETSRPHVSEPIRSTDFPARLQAARS